jgi:aminoglycoside phosphotransferase (APT) family kinase protein
VGHKLLYGEPLITSKVLLTATARTGRPKVMPAPSFGRELGRFLREVHSFPVERAEECGVKVVDGPALRADREQFRDEVVRDVFPLVMPATRFYINDRFDAYLCDDLNFDFQPVLVQGDMDRQNVLVDPQTGQLTGVIDFGGTNIGKPAVDFLLPLGDFEDLGISYQLASFIEAYGLPIDLEQARVEVEFIMRFLWPLYDVTFGLAIGNDNFVRAGVSASDALAKGGA